MKARTRTRIVWLRKRGWKLWAIADRCSLDVETVLDVLVTAGKVHRQLKAGTLAKEGKKPNG